MVDLLLSIAVILLQGSMSVWLFRVLRPISTDDSISLNAKVFGKKFTLSLVLLTVIFLVGHFLREYIYSTLVLNDILFASILINILLLVLIVLDKKNIQLKKFNKVLNLFKTLSWIVVIAGFGFYYIIAIIKVATSGMLV